MAITVEELEIIIQAKVDKVVPQIRKMLSDVKKELQDSDIDFSSISKSINREVTKTKPIIKKLKDDFNPEEVSFTINGESIKKEIKGISNQFSALRGSKEELANTFEFARQKQQLKSVGDEVDSVAQKMKNIGTSKVPFIQYDSAEIQKQVDALSGIKNVNVGGEQLEEVGIKADGLRSKFQAIIEQAKKLASATKGVVSKVADGAVKAGKLAIKFLGIRKNAESLKNTVSNGIKTLMKYAGALIGIRSIYNGLKSLASEWLNSNDSSAKQLKANLDYMKMAIGSTLKPVIETIINLIYKAVSAVQSLIYALSGVNIFAKMTASNYKSMAKSAGSASKATKQLAGVHNEINNISDSNGGSGSATPNIDLSKTDSKLTDWFKRLLDDAYGVGYEVGQKFNEGLKKIPWNKIQATTKDIAIKTAQFLNGFIAGTDWSLVGYTIGQGINTGLILSYNFLKEFDFKQFGNAIGEGLMSAIETIDWSLFASKISEEIKGFLDFLAGFIEKLDWHVIINAILRFIEGIDFSGISDSFFRLLGTALASLVNLGMVIGEYIILAVDKAKQYFQEKTEECGGNIVLGILKGIGDAVIGIGKWIIDHIFTPFIEGFKNAFGIHSPSTVMMEMGTFIMQGLFDGITSLVSKVLDIWENLKTKIVEITTNIKDKVKNKIQEMKESVVTKFNDLKTKALEKITNLKNNAVTTFENLKSSISTKISNIKNTIVNGFEGAVNYIKSLPSQAFQWGSDLVGNIVNGIKGKINDVRNAVSEVANNIRAYLHFTEPDVGPLSDFHTYMPDMINLMKQGIERNMGSLIDSVEEMAKEMSVTLYTGGLAEYSIEGISGKNGMQSFGFKDIVNELSSRNANNTTSGGVESLVVKIGDKTIFDEAIDYINNKSKRLGKNVIEVK